MQIVINNVSEEEYKDFCDRYIGSHNPVINAMCNGTPLPKGHGRLIDADALEYWKNNRPDEINYHFVPKYELDNAPTIIDADKEEK